MSNLKHDLPNPGILRDVQILVVDNDADSRYLCEILFESYGAKIVTAESILDGLTLLDSFIPDILICEIRFLNEDIRSLIQRIRILALNHRRIIPILVASAYCSASFASELIATAESHLHKPLDTDCLVDEVWNLIHLSRAIDQPNIQDWIAKYRVWAKRHTVEAI